MDLGKTAWRQDAPDGTKTEDPLPEHPTQGEHGAVTNQDAQQADHHHDVNIGEPQSGDDATGHERDVFRDGHPETTDQQDEKNRKITVIRKDSDQDIHLVFVTSSAARL